MATDKRAYVRRAHEVLGAILSALPEDFTASHWTIGLRGINIQRLAEPLDTVQRVRTDIRLAACILGLELAETPGKDHVKIHATGIVTGVRVEVWGQASISGTREGWSRHGDFENYIPEDGPEVHATPLLDGVYGGEEL